MRLTTSSLLVLCLVAISFSQVRLRETKSGIRPDRFFDQIKPFDEYGRTNWEDEAARLDNFAIQLMHDPELVGYIFEINGLDLCPGEAATRGMRARSYLVDQRGVPANRIIWKEDGYGDKFKTVLQLAPRVWGFSYPSFGSKTPPGKIHRMKNCRGAITRIRRGRL
jgi:hypothetical protein